jgi:thioredoxin-dependent peroxiredoxin
MAIVKFKGNDTPLTGTEVKVGVIGPDFALTANDLSEKRLSDYAGKVKVIAVYPSIDTPVCATQNRQFNKIAAELSDDVVVLSVSVDLPFAQTRFCAAEGIDRVVTLSDHKAVDFGLKYGFLIEPLRLLARGTVIIDKEDVVQFVEYVPEVTTEPDYDAALAALKKLI